MGGKVGGNDLRAVAARSTAELLGLGASARTAFPWPLLLPARASQVVSTGRRLRLSMVAPPWLDAPTARAEALSAEGAL